MDVTERLYRSPDDRMLAGVAGGLAEMLHTDPSLVRIVWAVLIVLTGGLAFLVYIVMAIVVPDEDTVYGPAGVPVADRRAGAPRTGGMSPAVLIGGFLTVLGGFFLLREIFPRIDFDWIWPLALVGLGVVLIVVAMGRGQRRDGTSPGAPPPDQPPPSPPAAPPIDPPPPDAQP